MYSIQIQTTEETKQLLKENPKKYYEGLVSGVRKATYLAEREAKKSFGGTDNLKVRTGYLRNTIKSNVIVMQNYISGILSSNAIYARIHELGGTIKPKIKNNLKFQIGGKWVTVKQVQIPERPFLEPAIKDNLPAMETIILEEISRSMK